MTKGWPFTSDCGGGPGGEEQGGTTDGGSAKGALRRYVYIPGIFYVRGACSRKKHSSSLTPQPLRCAPR